MAAVGLKPSLALSVLYLLWTVTAAPVDEGSSQALQLGESVADGRGCYYNFEHYGEGDRILTNEPCLNCTCHNRMLMCYLRVCPFTKAIGQDCTVEKKPDQCCPIITCPQVPVALLTSSTTSELPPTTTALGKPDNYGCILEDNTFYADGAQVPSDPKKPCELCYCIRNHTACVMQECTLNVEGCKPVYQDGICCPVRYDCDYDEVATTPKPTIGLVTTPGGPSDCLHNGRIYHDGAMVMKDEKAPCEHCYCMRGDIVCAVQECGTPLEGTSCTPMEPKHGQCCPNYKCANETQATENEESALPSSAEKLSESSISESDENEEHESNKKSSNESSGDESQKGSQEELGLEVSKPIADGLESNSHEQEFTSTNAPEQSNVSDDTLASSSQELYTKQPETADLITTETPLQENIVQQAGDSISEATQDQDVTHIQETIHNQEKGTTLEQEAVQSQETTPKQEVVPGQEEHQEDETTPKQEVNQEQGTTHDQQETSLEIGSQTLTDETEKDQQVPNEIPESTPPEKSEPITEEPAIEVARIPGEGSCLVEGQTYAHNTVIPTENPCQESCKCYSSIVTCKQKDCPPAPTQFEHCMPVTSPGSCCPTYMCDQKPSDAPEAQNQLVETTDDASHDDTASVDQHNHQTETKPAIVENEDKVNSIPPVVEGIPPDNLLPGSYENGVPVGQSEENLHETDIQTTQHTGTSADISSSNINEDENVNSHVVHGMDAAIDGGQLEAMDNKHENGNIPHSSEGITTMKPVKIDNESHEIVTTQEPESTRITVDNAAVHNEDPQKHETATVSLADHEMPQTTLYDTTSPRPSEEVSSHAQETIESENSVTVHSEVVETNDYVPEGTTAPQEVQKILEANVPTVNPHSEENINYITSSDSNLDESKNEENLITNKPLEISTSQESEGEILTEHYQYVTTQDPIGIPVDGSHSDNHNDLVQSQTDLEHTTASQENTYSESLPQAPSETIVNNENIESHGPTDISLPSGLSDEIQNPVTEENLSQTSSPTNQDAVTEANQASSGSLDSEKTNSPVSDQVLNETPTTSSPQEASINESSNDKLSETSINKVPGETNNEIKHDTEVTTDSVVQTTIAHETEPVTSEITQEESEAQESNNIITSSTEKETSEDNSTIFPTKSKDEETENGGKVVENTPHETQVPTEQTSDGTIHSDVIIDESPISLGEANAEATPTHEISEEEEAIEHVTKESDVETPTESKPQESVSYKPSEVTVSSISQEEGGSNDSSPEVIFEVITAAGMPSIESHVTEGTVDHSIHHINNLPNSDTQHTTEHSEPAKEPSNVKEVQSSSQPFSPEVLFEPTISTDKTIEEQPISETTPGYQIVPNAEDSNNEITSIQQETSPDILPSEIVPTQPPSWDGSSHKETTNKEENTQDTAEANPESIASQQTTINSETDTKVKDENSNQITSDSSTETNGNIDTEQNKIQIPISDDEKNEITSPEELIPNLSEQDSQSVSSSDFSTESADEISQHETTSITPTEINHNVIQQEPHVEDNTEIIPANHPKTEAPIDKEVIVSNEEQNPSEVQTDIVNDSHKDISALDDVNPNIEDSAVTSTPQETPQDNTATNVAVEVTQDSVQTNAPVDVTHDVVTNAPVETTQDSGQTNEPVHVTNAPVEVTSDTEVTNAPVETAQDDKVTNTPVEAAHDAEVTNAPVEVTQDTEVTNPPVEIAKDGEVTNAPVETTHDAEVTNPPDEIAHDAEVTNPPDEIAHDAEVTNAPVETAHDAETTNVPVETDITNASVETAQDDKVTNAPVEIAHDAEVTNAPVETAHDAEVTNAPVETAHDAEVTNAPVEIPHDTETTNVPFQMAEETDLTNASVETSQDDEVTNAPVEIPHDTETTNVPFQTAQETDLTNASVETSQDDEVTNEPVETSHDAEVTNEPVETAHDAEVTNAPVEPLENISVTQAAVETGQDTEITNAPVETGQEGEVMNAPVDIVQDAKVTNAPVETAQDAEVTNIPVEAGHNAEVTSAPFETAQETDTTNAPVETAHNVEVTNAPFETAHDTEVTNVPDETAQDTRVTDAPVEIEQDTEITNRPVETLENTFATQTPVETGQDTEVTNAPVDTFENTFVTHAPVEIAQDTVVTNAPVEISQDNEVTNAPVEISQGAEITSAPVETSQDNEVTNAPVEISQGAEIISSPVETVQDTEVTNAPVEISQDAEVTGAPIEITQDSVQTEAPVEVTHDVAVTNPPEEISQDTAVTHATVEKIEDNAATNTPIEIAHQNSEDLYHSEKPQQPNQSEILQQEPITETFPVNQAEDVPEDGGQVAEVTDTNKEMSTEVTSEKEPLLTSSEKSEVPLSDNKENIHEVPIESLSQPEQNSTPPPLTIVSESSTSHEEAIQVESTEPANANIPEENLQLSNEDLSAHVPQITHLEHVAPPAPNSDSHILETSETEGDTSTKATEETTVGNQVAGDQQQQNIEDQKIHDEIPSHEAEAEEPGSNKPLSEEVSKVPTTQAPGLTESSPGLEDHESSSMQAEIHMNITTQHPLLETVSTEGSKSTEVHPVAEDSQTTPIESIPVTQKIETTEETQRPEGHITVTESSTSVPKLPDKPLEHLSSTDHPTDQSSKVETVTHATETNILNEIHSTTRKPPHVHHEESPSFPTWSQKPFEHHTTPEPHPPEESHYPSGFDPEYEDEEGVSYGPGTCRYGGKVYLSAQQIPRDDPCDFCFCFRSDIICLQQSCPPPIRGCYQETIKGFCCPRYECHVSMATMLNITTTTTTTTTTLPPHFFAHAYNGAAMKAGCQVKDVAYSVGERIPSTSGPCLECRCGANGQMKCDPTVCGPQEALLRQVMDAAISRRR